MAKDYQKKTDIELPTFITSQLKKIKVLFSFLYFAAYLLDQQRLGQGGELRDVLQAELGVVLRGPKVALNAVARASSLDGQSLHWAPLVPAQHARFPRPRRPHA